MLGKHQLLVTLFRNLNQSAIGQYRNMFLLYDLSNAGKQAKTMARLGMTILGLMLSLIHDTTQQLQYHRFPNFYTLQRYPIFNGYFGSGTGGGFYHRYVKGLYINSKHC